MKMIGDKIRYGGRNRWNEAQAHGFYTATQWQKMGRKVIPEAEPDAYVLTAMNRRNCPVYGLNKTIPMCRRTRLVTPVTSASGPR